jgi:N-acetylglucosamine kinase-like BadF-type ATPase
MQRFRDDPFGPLRWIATATDYATFAPLVMRHADAGDPVARRIVQDAEQIDLVRRPRSTARPALRCSAVSHRRCSPGWRRMCNAGWFRSRATR